MNRNQWIVFSFIAAVPILWLLNGFVVYKIFPDWQIRAQFGEMFGVINSLFSGLAFSGLIYTLYIQRKESEKNYKALDAQLDEIRKSRLQQAQSLPFIEIENITLEKPKFYFSPPNREYSALSRCHIYFKVKNDTKYPAVSIDIKGAIAIPSGKTPFYLKALPGHIEILPGKSDVDSGTQSFLFSGDGSAKILQALRSKNPNALPILLVRTTFRNMLGVSFALNQGFFLDLKNINQDEIMNNWASKIITFENDYKVQLEEMRRVENKNEDKWSSLFEATQTEFSNSIHGEDQQSRWVSEPSLFKFELLDEKQYAHETKGLYHGVPIPTMVQDCFY